MPEQKKKKKVEFLHDINQMPTLRIPDAPDTEDLGPETTQPSRKPRPTKRKKTDRTENSRSKR